MTFGEFQKQERRAKNISIYRLAKITGISWAQLRNYEEGKGDPPIKKATLICKALDTKFVIGGE